MNLPSWWPSVRLDNPDPLLGNRYIYRHRSAVQSCGRSLTVVSNIFGRSDSNNSRTNYSLFRVHGQSSNPLHLIRAKSYLSFSKWIGFSGMLGVTFRREIALGSAILLLGLPDTECYTRKPSLGKLQSHFSAKLSRKGAGNACNRM